MPANSYGSYSPQEDNPFPIETNLATIAAGNDPTQARNLLGLYQQERETAMGNYNVAQGDQHEFAKRQLQQQLYEANLKALPELAKPGVARLMQGAPGYQGVFGGASPDVIAQSVGQAEAANQAETFSKVGSGTNAFSQAGYGIPIPAVEGMTGVTGLVPQTPRDIEIAKINAAARLGAASIGAAGSGGVRYSAQLPVSESTGGAPITASSGKGMSLPGFVTRLRNEGSLPPPPVQPPPAPGQVAPTPPPAQPPGQQGKAIPNQTKGADVLQQRASDYVERQVRTQNPKAYADIKAYAAENGGKIGLVGPDAKGQFKMQGKEHQY